MKLPLMLLIPCLALAACNAEQVEKIKTLQRKSAELHCKENLVIFRKMLQGDWQFQMIDPTLVSSGIQIPELTLPDHKPTKEIQEYSADVILKVDAAEILLDGSKLKDTGKWGYVKNTSGKLGGRVFIDCTHADQKGSEWYTW